VRIDLVGAFANCVPSSGSPAARLGGICNDYSNPYIEGIMSAKPWATIQSLLHECYASHDHCRLLQPKPTPELFLGDSKSIPLITVQLPTRVIVVDLDRPRLLETNGARGIYVALSHCWGDVHTVKTTRQNVERHKERITLSPVFRTFSEALMACKVLGIPYLWIDSLCIIQHDPSDPESTLEDFNKESQLMGQVYGRAVLTIAATGASDAPTMGLFSTERNRLRQLVEIPFRMNRDESEPSGYMYASTKPKGFVDEISDSRLFTRGWVFQERLLSARYLHFGREQWFWQCRERTFAESDQQADDSGQLQPPQRRSPGADLGMAQAISKSGDEFSNWWSQAVEIYSELDFTRPADRTIAIKGLMNEIGRISKRQYFWGIWAEALHLQMMWYSVPGTFTAPPLNHRPSPTERMRRGVPSWSWLESDEPIRFMTPGDRSTFKQSGSQMGYPGGTTAVSAFKWRLAQPPISGRDGRTSAAAHSPSATAPLRSEYLFISGLLRSGYILAISDFRESLGRLQYAAGLRLGPIAMLANGGLTSTPSFPYRLLDKAASSDPGVPDEMTPVGYCIAEEQHIGKEYSARSHAVASDEPRPTSEASSTATKRPIEIVCLLVSNNTVSQSGRSWRTGGNSSESDLEPVGQTISRNVLLLQKLDATRPIYRRIGIGVVLREHIGWFEGVGPSTICLW